MNTSHPRVSCAFLIGLRVALLLIAVMTQLIGLSGCAKDPVRPLPEPLATGPTVIDVPLAWSRDGQWVAFRRSVQSSYGPPGMYVVHRTGSIVRHVFSPADIFFPREATFSPDGRFIAAVDSQRQLFIVNLQTLVVARPLYTPGEMYYPDWSPDGNNILILPNTEGGLDSAGLHLFNAVSGEYRQLLSSDGPIFASSARWSPDGNLIAFSELVDGIRALSVINADGTGHRFLIPPRSLQQFDGIDWYRRSPGAALQVFFRRAPNPGAGPYLINLDGTGLTPFWHGIRSEGYLSPAGKEFVRLHPSPTLQNWVLYVGLIDDVTDLSLRQITRYEP